MDSRIARSGCRESSLALVAGATLAAIAACSTGKAPTPDSHATTVLATDGDSPLVYVAKIKNVLLGIPPTDAEVQAVIADPTALSGLVDGWIATPQYRAKMMVFFELAFQQTQISITDLAEQFFPQQADANAATQNLVVQNVRESFARTALELIDEGKPFTEAMTTHRFMLTPALMELYAFLDAWQVDDTGKVTDHFRAAHPTQALVVEASAGPIPIADSLDPSSASYMHWYDPDVGNAAMQPPGCTEDPITYPAPVSGFALHFILYGTLSGRKAPDGKTQCLQRAGSAQAGYVGGTDFTDWRMVTVHAPAAGQGSTAFYDLPTLRKATDLALVIPRVGFFSTPAFFANWQTNISNQARVTTNQALIVATGASIDGTDGTMPPQTPGLDAMHAAKPECAFCHQLLDPTRSILASTFSWDYHTQTDPNFKTQKGLFAFQGVVKPVATVDDFASTLATHPLFATAWAEKLCYFVNSAPCEQDDPEFMRVVEAFKSSGYSWNTLVRELLSSPVVTHAKRTSSTGGASAPEVVAVARRDHLCAALDNRLGLVDVCGLDVLTKVQTKTTIPEIVSGLPSDGYGRGAVAPVLPNQPTLFYRAGTENVCTSVAELVIDGTSPPGARHWSSGAPDAAIADFVAIVMALTPSDPRATPAAALLRAHFDAATKSGASASDALKSTFVAACIAPSAISIGL
jgi:hypothetical protein